MSDISLPYRPRTTEDPQAAGVVQSNLEYLVGLFQKGTNDGDTMHWDAVLGKWVAGPPVGTGVPAGATMAWWSNAEPANWAFLHGQTLANAQTVYPDLWANMDPGFRSGPHIILPDTRGRALYGVGAGTPGVHALNATEGQPNVSLRGPHHGHSISDPGHQHWARAQAPKGDIPMSGNYGILDQNPSWTDAAFTGITVGSQGYSIQNAPSHIACNWIIKLKN